MASFQVSQILDKMNNADKDFRYMATSDLSTELAKDTFKIDAESERKICVMLLKLLLEDNSGDVQGLAVKCLGPLVKKVQESRIQDLVDKIADQLLRKEDKKAADVRDIASMGLKTIVAEAPTKEGSSLVKRLTPRLVASLGNEEFSTEVKHEALDILNDLLARFGTLMTKDHEAVMKAVLPQLTAGVNTRKRAISCLGHLSVYIPEKLFTSLVEFLIEKTEQSTKADHIRTYIQAIGAISRSVGYRLGRFLPRVVPLIAKSLTDSRFEQDDELKENCFQTFESLVLRCPKEIAPELETIRELAVSSMRYDPNYAVDDDEEMEGGDGEEEDDEDEDDGEEADFSDDDDMSWKVRRASAKALAAIIATRPELLMQLYKTTAEAIIKRFREREENVKLDVFNTFRELLKQTTVLSKKSAVIVETQSPVHQLRPLIKDVVTQLSKQLRAKSTKHLKTKIGIFAVLRDLVLVDHALLADHMDLVISGVESCLVDKSSNANLRIEALTFLRLLLPSHPATIFQGHIKRLSPPVLKAVGDTYYKITAEALRVLAELVKLTRPPGGAVVDYAPFVAEYYKVTYAKLKALDVDQEVKESAITCMSLIIANMGDQLGNDLRDCLKILLERLSNEITRLVTVKALALIASPPLQIDLSSVIEDAVGLLSTFLRQTNRQLKQSSLQTLDVVVKNYSSVKGVVGQFPNVLGQLAPLISEADLHLAHLALNLAVHILMASPDSAAQIKEKMFPKIMELVESSLLQGLALESLLALFGELVVRNSKSFGFDFLLEALLNTAKKPLHKQCYSSLAQCIAAVVVKASPAQRDSTVARFMADVKKPKEETKLVGLLCLGEIGRRVDLSSHADIQNVIISVFDSAEETTLPTAASFSLGSIAVGNLDKFLTFILAEIERTPARQYLLLHSLKEVISKQSASADRVKELVPYIPNILALLLKHCESPEEGARNVVAECLGKLGLIAPEQIIPHLSALVPSPSVANRNTVITALKFTVVEQPHPVDTLLHNSMGHFLSLLQDSDLNVRRSALLTFNYIAHNKPLLIRDLLPTVLPVVYAETKLKPELTRVVDLGPFKHTVDDGLELRKAAFECMYTLLETTLERLEVGVFISHIATGLSDVYDIKLLCHLMVIRLATAAPASILTSVDSLIDSLKTTVITKPKDSAVKQEIDRNEELVRSALRATAALSRVANIDQHLKFEEFLKTIRSMDLNEKYESIRNELDNSAENKEGKN